MQDEPAGANEAIAVLEPTQGSSASGVVTLHQTDEGTLQISGAFEGLTPEQKHSIQIHQYGDLSAADGSHAGEVFNPDSAQPSPQAAAPEAQERPAGDLGEFESDQDGNAHLTMETDALKLEGDQALFGRTIVIRKQADAEIQPEEASPFPVAQGVIGIKNPESDVSEVSSRISERVEQAAEETADTVRSVIEEIREAVKGAQEELETRREEKPR